MDNVKEQQAQHQQLPQENEAAELSGKDTDTTPLIQETDGEVPNQNQTIDTEQVKNIPEGMSIGLNLQRYNHRSGVVWNMYSCHSVIIGLCKDNLEIHTSDKSNCIYVQWLAI